MTNEKNTQSELIWPKNPQVLISNFDIFPCRQKTISQNVNIFTRLLILVSILLIVFNYKYWYVVLLLGLILILLFNNYYKEDFSLNDAGALSENIRGFVPGYDSKPHKQRTQACWFNANQDILNAAYEVTPNIQFNHDQAAKRSYMNTKYELTPLTQADGFTEIWRSEPEMEGNYSMIPDPVTEFPVEQELPQGQCHYIIRSKIDHLPVGQSQTDLIGTRPIVEAAFNDSAMAFRNSIMNEHIDRFRRERQHNCADMKLNSFSAGSGGSA